MTVIPEFLRRSLISQRVGTPGVDVSGATAGRILGGALGALSETLLDPLVKQEAERRKVQIAQDKAIQTVASTNRANKDALTYRNQSEILKEEHVGDIESLQEKLRNLRDTFFQETDDATYRGKFSKRTNDFMNSTTDKFFQERKEKNLQAGVDDLNGTVDEAAAFVSTSFADPKKGFLGMLDNYMEAVGITEDAIEDGRQGLSAKAMAAFKKERDLALVQAAVNGLMDTKPELVEGFLNSAEFRTLSGDALTGEDKTAILKEAADFIAKKKQVAKEVADRAQADAEGAVLDKIADGKMPSLTEIANSELQGKISTKFATVLRRLKKSTKARKLGNNPRSYLELDTQLRNLAKAKKEEDVSEASVDPFILERLALLRQNTLEARAGGTVSKKEADAIHKIIGGEFTRQISEVVRKLNVLDKGSKMGEDLPRLIFTEAGDIEKATMDFQISLLKRINKAEDEGERLSVAGVRIIVDELKDEFLFQNNPNRGKVKIGQVVTDELGTYEVVGFDSDGEPLVRDVDTTTRQKEPKE